MIRKCLAFKVIIHLAMVLKQLCPATERLLETQNLLVGFLFLYLKADNFINFAPCNQTHELSSSLSSANPVYNIC